MPYLLPATNTGGYFRPGDDPRRVTWFDDEIAALCETAALAKTQIRQALLPEQGPRVDVRECSTDTPLPKARRREELADLGA